MKWTSETPKVEGWYWWRALLDMPPVIVSIYNNHHGRRDVAVPMEPLPRRLTAMMFPGSEWSGPIPEPEE